MPKDAEILCVQIQGGFPRLWVKVDTEKDEIFRAFRFYGTGSDIFRDEIYIGTVQLDGFVWHLFETA